MEHGHQGSASLSHHPCHKKASSNGHAGHELEFSIDHGMVPPIGQRHRESATMNQLLPLVLILLVLAGTLACRALQAGVNQ